jgi:phospholipid/cholesterol/gamma-HCH transport system substrate-binding protein
MSGATWRERLRGTRATALTVGAVVLALALAAGGRVVYDRLTTHTVTGYFASTTGLYVGDEVKVLGVEIGRITKIEPGPDAAKVTMALKSSVDIPADARAVIVAPTLVTGRFVQLAPRYRGGPKLADGGRIPLQHTAVPVEWDDIKRALNTLSTALGPTATDPNGSLSRLIDVGAANLDGGTAASLHEALTQLSQTMSLLSDGRADLFSTIRNLQVFVNVLSHSNTQIVEFGGRLASVSQVLADSSNALGTSLDSLDAAVGQVKDFLASNTAGLTEDLRKLQAVTQQLVDKRPEIEQVLHVAPTALQNFYQIYQPAQGALAGALAVSELRSPVAFICGAVEGVADNGSQKTADLCRQYLAPILNSMALAYPPLLFNPATGLHAFPDQLVYSPPSLQDRVLPRTADAGPATGGGR